MARIQENIKIYIDFTGRRAYRSWDGVCDGCNKRSVQWLEEDEESIVIKEKCKNCNTGAALTLTWELAELLTEKATERRLKGQDLEAW